MYYEFPVINHIDDVLPAIKDRDEFVVAEKDGYTVLNYNVILSDTFPTVLTVHEDIADDEFLYDLDAALRRECRGIIFCSETGNILRRPFSKFFNVNEKEETQDNTIDLSRPHVILEKLDGSMIVPFYVNDRMIWGTKMGETNVAEPVMQFVTINSHYCVMAHIMMNDGLSPIFEWCSRKQKIVLDYKEDQLILTAIRDIKTGKYCSYEFMKTIADKYDIPVVKAFELRKDMKEFIEYTRGLVDTEGFVVRFDNGHMVKLKSDWYVAIHKAKEAILSDRNIVQMILDGTIDDVKAHLDEEDRNKLTQFESDFNTLYIYNINNLQEKTKYFFDVCSGERKTFALNYSKDMHQIIKAGIFYLWDENTPEKSQAYVEKTVRSNLTKNINWSNLSNDIFDGIKLN